MELGITTADRVLVILCSTSRIHIDVWIRLLKFIQNGELNAEC